MIATIERKLRLDAPLETVWTALTDSDALARWFSDSAEISARPGAAGWLYWKSHGRFAVRIETCEPMRSLSWRWMHDADVPFDEAASTLVEWSLRSRDDGGTDLELRESGFRTAAHREENSGGWDHELAELEQMLAGG